MKPEIETSIENEQASLPSKEINEPEPSKVDAYQKESAKHSTNLTDEKIGKSSEESNNVSPETTNESKKRGPNANDEDETPASKKTRQITYDLNEKNGEGDGTAKFIRKSLISQPTVTPAPLKETSSHGQNALGNLRMRSLSPSRYESTQCIYITNLKRPFTLMKLQENLRTFGDFESSDFWLDDCRSSCIVKYETVEQAERARNELHGVKWPNTPEAPIIKVDFITEEKAKRVKRGSSMGKANGRNSTDGGSRRLSRLFEPLNKLDRQQDDRDSGREAKRQRRDDSEDWKREDSKRAKDDFRRERDGSTRNLVGLKRDREESTRDSENWKRDREESTRDSENWKREKSKYDHKEPKRVEDDSKRESEKTNSIDESKREPEKSKRTEDDSKRERKQDDDSKRETSKPVDDSRREKPKRTEDDSRRDHKKSSYESRHTEAESKHEREKPKRIEDDSNHKKSSRESEDRQKRDHKEPKSVEKDSKDDKLDSAKDVSVKTTKAKPHITYKPRVEILE